MKRRRLGRVVALIFICAIVIGVLLYNNSDSVRYRKQMELGDKFLAEEDYEQARVAYEKAIEIEPANVEPYIGLTEACMNIAYERKTEESYILAKLSCERAIKVDAQNVDFYIYAAESCINLQDEVEAEKYLQEAKNIAIQGKHDISAYIKISQLYYEKGDHESAMKLLESAMEIDEENQEVKDKYLEIGLTLVEKHVEEKSYKDALELLDEIGNAISNNIIESKKQEISEILEKQEAEQIAKAEAEAAAKEKKEQEKLNREIIEWQVRNLGLITEYPVLQGYDRNDRNIYHLGYGYGMDYYTYWYTFSIDENTWIITEHEIYDSKSGEMYSIDTNIGKTYNFTITDELRNEYNEYKERQIIFSEYITLLNKELEKMESKIYTDFEMEDCYLEEYSEEGKMIGTLVYWPKGTSSFIGRLIIKVSVNAETNEIIFLDFDEGYNQYDIDYSKFDVPIVLNG